MSSKVFAAQRFDEKGSSFTREWVVEEGPLQLRVNGKPFTVTLRTPGADRQLCTGLLFAEGLVEIPSDILSLREEPSTDETAVWSAMLSKSPTAEKLANRSLASTSSCGMCGKTEWEEAAPPTQVIEEDLSKECLSTNFIDECFVKMNAKQGLFAQTGGCHAAGVFSAGGDLLAFGEDAGRHNAVDKAIGDLWWRGRLNEAILLCVSGRVSYEIASKASRAGIIILAAVSAPSSLAVEFCERVGITLAGFCRARRATVYSHAERLIESGMAEAIGA